MGRCTNTVGWLYICSNQRILSRYNQDTLGRNNLQMSQNNTFNTLGRNGNTFQRNSAHNDLSTSTLGRNNRYSDVPITNPLFQQR